MASRLRTTLAVALAAMAPTAAMAAVHFPRNPTMADVYRIVGRKNVDTLLTIGRCEQPRAGRRFGIYWDAPYTAYVGGLGMARSTFQAGSSMGPHYPLPPKATPEQQLIVGWMVASRWGFSAWGCFA
jgi:hypothetical protein